MSFATISGRRILTLWIGAILLSFAVVRLGESLAATHGRPTGFYVGSLFVWIIWLAWIATWRWTGARKARARAPGWGWLQLLLAVMGAIWLGATVIEYL